MAVFRSYDCTVLCILLGSSTQGKQSECCHTRVARGMKGHIIIYPQNLSAVTASHPPTIEEITFPLCVLFIGASKPSAKWLRDKAKP